MEIAEVWKLLLGSLASNSVGQASLPLSVGCTYLRFFGGPVEDVCADANPVPLVEQQVVVECCTLIQSGGSTADCQSAVQSVFLSGKANGTSHKFMSQVQVHFKM